jgi:predicted acetyltransferase
MKIRNGFVSNSSSSSFLCVICGEVNSGYDLVLKDAYMTQCENGHIFCNRHTINETEITKEMLLEFIEDKELSYYNNDETIESFMENVQENYPSYLCPVCTFKEITEEDLKSYIKKEFGISELFVLEKLKEKNVIKKVSKKIETIDYNNFCCELNNITKQDLKIKISKKFKSFENFYKFLNQ